MPLPDGWDAIPGARGCTPESCAFRDHHAEIRGLSAEVFGMSTQSTDYQREVHDRLHLTFDLLSDPDFAFAYALGLPLFEVAGLKLLKRVTLVCLEGRVEHVLIRSFPRTGTPRKSWHTCGSRLPVDFPARRRGRFPRDDSGAHGDAGEEPFATGAHARMVPEGPCSRRTLQPRLGRTGRPVPAGAVSLGRNGSPNYPEIGNASA